MAEPVMRPTAVDVDDYIDTVDDERKRDDSRTLVRMMSKLTGEKPIMWGPSIIGFGTYHYKYATGHEGDAPIAGFSPRKGAITIYLSNDFDQWDDLMPKLGKCKTSKACLYVKKLDDIDLKVLEQMIKRSIADVKKKYP